MNAAAVTKDNAYYANRVMWVGFAIALLSMAVLFIAGLVTANSGMTVMASSTGAALGAAAVSTHVAINKKK